MSWLWIVGFIAILFNPFIQIHFGKELRLFIDFVVSITFLLGIFALSGEGAAKSIFKTRAFRIFRKIALVISLCILIVIVLVFIISGVRDHLRKKAIQRRITPGFVLEEQHQSFDIRTARPVDGYFIETYSKGEIIIIGNLEDGKENGIWRIYDKYGNLRAEKKYEKGILTDEVKVFNENGELVRKYPCKEGEIIGGISSDDFENGYLSDLDVTNREAVSFVNMEYQDDNIKARLLPPFLLKNEISFEVEIEMVNKTKIIRNMRHGLTGAYLKDNYGNLITITSLIPYADLRFGDKKKIIFSSLELPLRNTIYLHFRIPKDTLWNLIDMNFIFPVFFIEEKTNSNIENR